jgi:hypothetical protein
MAIHAEYALRGARISEVLDFPLAIPACEARRTESLIAGQNCKVLDLVTAAAAAICTIVADQGPITEEQEVGIGIEKGAAAVASEAFEMPSVASCMPVSTNAPLQACVGNRLPSSKAFPSSSIYVESAVATWYHRRGLTSPQPLHGYEMSSVSYGDSG